MPKVKPQFQCQHIMDSGRRCGSPRMKRKEFCYYHLRTHESFVLPGHEFYEPPVLDNYHSIALAMRHVHTAHTKRLINTFEAKTMLYNLQLAQQNLRLIEKSTPIHQNPEDIETTYTPAMRHLLWLEDELPDPINPTVPCPHCGQRLQGDSQVDDSACHDDRDSVCDAESDDFCHAERSEVPLPNDASDCNADRDSACHGHRDSACDVESDDFCHAERSEVPLPDQPFSANAKEDREPLLPTRRPNHPLYGASGLRPYGSPLPDEGNPYTWVPVTEAELVQMEEAGFPRDDERKTRHQAYNIHRLRISRHLREHSANPTTRQLITAVAGAFLEEKKIEREIELAKKMAEAEYKQREREPVD